MTGFLAKTMLGDGQSIMHPLVRAQKAVSVIGDVGSDVRNGELRDENGAVIDVTPDQRRIIGDAMSDFALTEMRNALIETGVRGWTQKAPTDSRPPLSVIEQASPAVYRQLYTRLALENSPTPMAPEANDQLVARWAEAGPVLSGRQDVDQIIAMMRAKRQTGDRASRCQEGQRVVGGAYQPMTQGTAAPGPANDARPMSGGMTAYQPQASQPRVRMVQ